MYQSTPVEKSIIRMKTVDSLITWLVVVNAALLGLETIPSIEEHYGAPLLLVNTLIIGIFIVELAVKMYIQGWSFWRNGWNVFDFVVVGLTTLPVAGNLSILRSFRVLRALRLVSGIPAIRRVVDGLIHAIPGMGAVIGLLMLVFYIFAVMATQLFANDSPVFFGDIGKSAYTLFQLMIFDDWGNISRPIIQNKPWAWMFFIAYTLTAGFAVLNLLVGVIVDAMQSRLKDE